MYRVTELKNGVNQGREDFPDQETLLKALGFTAGKEYIAAVGSWLKGGAHEPLVINESSVWSDLWEYIP